MPAEIFVIKWYYMSQIHARGNPMMKGCYKWVKFT